MKTAEQLQSYIDKTPGDFFYYQFDFQDLQAIRSASGDSFIEGACLAFELGRAKGYRAAKAEQRKAKRGTAHG